MEQKCSSHIPESPLGRKLELGEYVVHVKGEGSVVINQQGGAIRWKLFHTNQLISWGGNPEQRKCKNI